jgi:AcrR family transcriptional regulator
MGPGGRGRAVARRERTNDPEGLRRRIVDVAYAAFHARGYHATPLDVIKREAGVTGGAFSHHFPTKKALGLAVIRDRVARTVEETWIEPLLAAPTAAEGVRAVLAGTLGELERRRAVMGCPLNNLALELSLHDRDFRVAVEALYARWRSAIAEKLRADVAAGRASTRDPDALATFVVAVYSGGMALAKASQSTTPLEVCADELADLMDTPTGRAGASRKPPGEPRPSVTRRRPR